jgi:hypothetical protein
MLPGEHTKKKAAQTTMYARLRKRCYETKHLKAREATYTQHDCRTVQYIFRAVFLLSSSDIGRQKLTGLRSCAVFPNTPLGELVEKALNIRQTPL